MNKKEENFIVRQANSLDDVRWIIRRAEEEGWGPREKDAEYLSAINFTRYFFVGELNGERISCIAIAKYSEDLAYLGYYLVIEPHRGKGYGYRTWKYAYEASSIGEQCNVGLYAVVNMEKTYIKSGFKQLWMNGRYMVTASDIAEALSATTPPEGIKTLPGSGVDINKLAEYDRSIFGANRQLAVASWICISDASFVAFNKKTEIVGYIILRKAINFEKEGYSVVPLFADDMSIALLLLRRIIEVIGPDKSNKLTFDIPPQGNIEGVEFLKKCNAVEVLDTFYMSTKGVRYMPTNKVYGVASRDIG